MESKPSSNPILEELNRTLETCPEGIPDSKAWADKYNFDHTLVVGICKSEVVLQKIAMSDPKTINVTTLSAEAKDILANGTPEFKIYHALPAGFFLNFCFTIFPPDFSHLR